MTTITRKLPLISTTIRPRGPRRTPQPITLLGVETRPGTGQMDTSDLRGVPLELLVMHAAEEGVDPSEALAAGVNALKIARLKALAPSLTKEVAERLHLNPTQARLTAMHIQKMARQSGRSPSDIISALELTAPTAP
jgi:hypothetical protein